MTTLIQSLVGSSSYRANIQVAPVRQMFAISTSNQSVFTTSPLLQGRYTIYGSNCEIYQNGYKLGYIDNSTKDYEVISIYNGSTTSFQISLTNPAYTGDYLDAVFFPSYVSTSTAKSPPGYIYQNFYDLWSVNNNNLSWTLGNVGVGTTAPTSLLHVNGNAYIAGALSACNLNILGSVIVTNSYEYITSIIVINNNGYGPALSVTQQQSTSQPVATFLAGASQALYINNTGNVGVGTNIAPYALTVNGDIQFTGSLFQNNGSFTSGWNLANNSIYTYSNVGIGVTNPAYALDVVGTIRASADVFSYSDVRLKTNIEPIKNALNTIDILQGVIYDRIDLNGKTNIGLIAQEVHKIIPEVVDIDNNGYMSVSYGNLVSLLIEGIKDLNNIVKTHEKRIEELEAKK